MKTFNKNTLLVFIYFCVLILNCTLLFSQQQVHNHIDFRLDSNFGDKTTYEFEIKTPGVITIDANWSGSADKLSLILNGPGQVGYYSRTDGKSPLKINFNVTLQTIQKGTTWKISIVNFSKKGIAKGSLSLSYPIKQEPRNLEGLTIVDRPQAAAATEASENGKVSDTIKPSDEDIIQRRILEDGTVELTYPDGTVKQIFYGGYKVAYPNGMNKSVGFMEIPPPKPPALPQDERIIDYLNWQTNSLLDLIKNLLGQDEESISNFLNHETEIASNIYEKMYIRTSYLEWLLSN